MTAIFNNGNYEINEDSNGDLVIKDSTGSEILKFDDANTKWDLPSGVGGGAVPVGTILMWSGTISNIPDGWALCDGNNGTPDLTDKFVKSVSSSSEDPGTTGGSTSYTTSGHDHNTTTTSTAVSAQSTDLTVLQDVSVDSDNDSISDVEPPHYEIAYIQKQ